MREQRPVRLTERERRALRAIENDLTCDDPALAVLMDEDGPLWRRRPSAFVVAVAVLLVIGLIVADGFLRTGGAMLLLVVPPAVWWLATRTTVTE